MRGIKILLVYSLVESCLDMESYSIHPVVHDWCTETISYGQVEFILLALLIVGFAVPTESEREGWLLQQRLLPHVDRCIRQLHNPDISYTIKYSEFNAAFHNLGLLFYEQGKLVEAEKMYQRALDGYEKAQGAEHTSTLDTVNNLGVLYKNQGKLVEAEEMYQRALDGYEKVWGPEHTSTLNTVNNLGNLYKSQGKLVGAEQMYRRALTGFTKLGGLEHTKTNRVRRNLSSVTGI